MKILVIGKNSYIGNHTDEWLKSKGIQVTQLDVLTDDWKKFDYSFCGHKYRQHDHNVIETGETKIETITQQYSNLKTNPGLKSGFAKILLDLINIDDDVRNVLTKVVSYKESFHKKFSLLLDNSFKTKDFVKQISFRYSVLLGLY